jgi:hypothetical protein
MTEDRSMYFSGGDDTDLAPPQNTQAKPVTVADFDALVEQMKVAYAEQEEKKAAATEANKKVSALEAKCVAYLDELKRDNFSTPFGTPYVIQNWKVKNPDGNEEKQAFFKYLEQKGGQELVLKYMTVNNNSLNSLYKTELKEAEARGELLSIPGLGAPSLYKSLGWRKAK